MKSSLDRLVRMLSGSFSNKEQAFENPPLYAHILVKLRPLPQLAPGSLLLEQSYAINPSAPYRIRVLRAEAQNGKLKIINQALAGDQRFWGAVEDAELRSSIKTSDLIPLGGCAYVISEESEGFVGEMEPGCRCLVRRKEITSYVVARLELKQNKMSTIDRGYDPQTHEHLWGSLAGPFEFARTNDYSNEIPLHWTEQWRN